ncbi:MAG: hypothetical protein ACKV2U_22970 [Bryobacteraceae bacterium]
MIQFASSGPKSHLWVLLADPTEDGISVIVSVTTLRHNADKTVILQPGDHPFIRHPSFVLFADSQFVSTVDLGKWIETGFAKPHQPFSSKLLKDVLEGVMASDFTPRKIIDFFKRPPTFTR